MILAARQYPVLLVCMLLFTRALSKSATQGKLPLLSISGIIHNTIKNGVHDEPGRSSCSCDPKVWAGESSVVRIP